MRRRIVLLTLSNKNKKKKKSFLSIFPFLKQTTSKKTKNTKNKKQEKTIANKKTVNKTKKNKKIEQENLQTFDSLDNSNNSTKSKQENKKNTKMKTLIIILGIIFLAYFLYSLSPILFGGNNKVKPQIPEYNNKIKTNDVNTSNKKKTFTTAQKSNITDDVNVSETHSVMDFKKLFQKRCDLFAKNNTILIGLNNQIYIDDNMYSINDSLNFPSLSSKPVKIVGYKFINPDMIVLALKNDKFTCQIPIDAFKNFEFTPYFEAVTIKEKNSNKAVDYMTGDVFSFDMKIKKINYPNIIISTPVGIKIIKKDK